MYTYCDSFHSVQSICTLSVDIPTNNIENSITYQRHLALGIAVDQRKSAVSQYYSTYMGFN